MTEDIRLDTNVFDHPKMVRLGTVLGSKGQLAIIRLWCWAAKHRTKGRFTGMDAVDIAIAAGWVDDTLSAEKFLEILCSAEIKLLKRIRKTYALHDWKDNQPWVWGTKERKQSAKRNAAKRWGKTAKKSLTPAIPKSPIQGNDLAYANSMRSVCDSHKGRNAPSPSPSPSPSLKKEEESSMQKIAHKEEPAEVIPYMEIISDLNQRTGKSFKPTTAETKRLVNGRVADGYKLSDFVHVHSVKAAEWMGDAKYEQYLCPTTLYRPGNFEKYRNQKAQDNRAGYASPEDIQRANIRKAELAEVEAKSQAEADRSVQDATPEEIEARNRWLTTLAKRGSKRATAELEKLGDILQGDPK